MQIFGENPKILEKMSILEGQFSSRGWVAKERMSKKNCKNFLNGQTPLPPIEEMFLFFKNIYQP